MSTMTLVRSCFSACWLPLDDHEPSSSPHVAVKNMTFERKHEKNFNSICNNNLSQPSKKCHSKRQLSNPIIKDKDGVVPIGNKFDLSSWSLSTDEDYIVFCFGKDVAQGDKGAKSDDLIKGINEMHKNSRPVNRELKYDEDEEQVIDLNIHEKRSNVDQHYGDQDYVTPYKEVQCHVEGIEGSAESRNSDQSEGSRSSFAFPVLGWEWIGSPVQMPKSEGFHQRKHKTRAVRFQCCRF